jgi:Na+/melibiose symporter-like transporter
LRPEIATYSKIDLQRFIGIEQSLQSLVMIVGPALAALLLGLIGSTLSLGITAAMSFIAALVTVTLPRGIGVLSKRAQVETGDVGDGVGEAQTAIEQPTPSVLGSLREGLAILFKNDKVITTSLFLVFGIAMIMASFQGLVLPVFFTETGRPEMLGYVLSVMSLGILIGSVVYSVIAAKLRKRTWYVISLIGMVVGVAVMGFLPVYPVMMLGAFILGALSGPISALLGLLFLERIPEERLGSVMGTQNSLLLIVAPTAIFLTSVLVSSLGTQVASFVLLGLWVVGTIVALMVKGMRGLDEQDAQGQQAG